MVTMKIPLKLSEKLGIAKTTLWRINRRHTKAISPTLARKILEAMEGKLSAEDIYPEIMALAREFPKNGK